ncbi:MobF family relaxase [Lentzea sp. NPDC042327]|uniref:MobF family relaxase n=1 Tax=Lentzea sp. NPDC042327 TaxID=3154801 RepID=UPI0033EB8318
MLRITQISVGAAGVRYLLRAAGCAEHDHAKHSRDAQQSGAEYLLAGAGHGEPAGVWQGRGLEMVGLSAGAQVTEEQMLAVYGRLEHWETGEPLGSRPREYASEAARVVAELVTASGLPVEQVAELSLLVRGAVDNAVAQKIAAEGGSVTTRRRAQIVAKVHKAPPLRLATVIAAASGVTEESIEAAIRRAKTARRVARAYSDFTYSPVKSVSVYHAALVAAGDPRAELVLEAHRQAVREAMEFLEDNVDSARVGKHTTVTLDDGSRRTIGEYALIKGFVNTYWEHSSSREGDPHIHTHVAMLNRCETLDGRIVAVDSQQFEALKGAAAMLYERRTEELVSEWTGARFAWRPDGKAREILGVSRALCDESSSRARQMQERLDVLVGKYRDQHGCEPDFEAMKGMRREAWASSRKAKSMLSPEAIAERYRVRAGEKVLKDQVRLVDEAAARYETEGVPAGERHFADEDALLKEAVRRTQEKYASWNRTALTLELNTLIGEVRWGANTAAEITRLADRATSPDGPADVLMLAGQERVKVPAALREGLQADSRSIYRASGAARFVTREHLSAEQQLVAEAHLQGAPQLHESEREPLAAALREAGLGEDQLTAVVGIMTSGKAADTLIGPAGAGKSRTVGELNLAWQSIFGAPVLGLATSQRATEVLRDDGLEALNVAAFLARYMPEDERAGQQLPRGTMIVVDEAGMADTDKLARIATLVRKAGGKLLYTGDQEQLSAVGSGGLLRLMALDAAPFVLTEIHRFKTGPQGEKSWEADASILLRAGDVEGLREYERRGRLRGGTKAEVNAAAVRGYLADLLQERETVLVAATNADAADLSRMVRDELVALGVVGEEVLAELRDGTVCGAGDVLQARKIDRRQEAENGQMVVNRELLTAIRTNDAGQLVARRHSDGTLVYLSPEYVDEHLTLGYAGTVHAVQGRTVDASHSIVELGMSRNGVYVEATRGRYANHLYAVTEKEGDEHDQESYSIATSDVMRQVLATDGGAISAVESYRAELESADSLRELGALWQLVARDVMTDRHHDLLLAQLGSDQLQNLVDDSAHDRLMTTLRHAEMTGHDIERLIADALASPRSLRDASSAAAVLRGRVQKQIRAAEGVVAPTAWTDRVSSYAGVVSEFAREVAELMDQRVEMIARAAVMAPPDWALFDIGPLPDNDDAEARQEWARKVGVVGAYREMYAVDLDVMGIGLAPSRDQDAVKHVAWTAAWEAMGCPEEVADQAELSDEQLREQVRRWECELAWAPVMVETELEKTLTLREEFQRESMLRHAEAQAQLEQDGGVVTSSVLALREKAQRADRMVQRFAEQAARYERLDAARTTWVHQTRDVAESAKAAAVELENRHPVKARQLELFADKDLVVDERQAVRDDTAAAQPQAAEQAGRRDTGSAATTEAGTVDTDAEAVRGDHGTSYRLDEVAEADVHYPAPEVDEDQLMLFTVDDPSVELRVDLGKVRDDSEMTMREAERRAGLSASRQAIEVEKRLREAEAAQEERRRQRERADEEASIAEAVLLREAEEARERAERDSQPEVFL